MFILILINKIRFRVVLRDRITIVFISATDLKYLKGAILKVTNNHVVLEMIENVVWLIKHLIQEDCIKTQTTNHQTSGV